MERITPQMLKAAKDRADLAQRRVRKAAAAQLKLNELHRERGAENAAAEKHFAQLCRAFAEQAIQETQP